MTRTRSMNQKVETPFGNMYIAIEYDSTGAATGGWISHPMKNETSEITKLVEALSLGLNKALSNVKEGENSLDGA